MCAFKIEIECAKQYFSRFFGNYVHICIVLFHEYFRTFLDVYERVRIGLNFEYFENSVNILKSLRTAVQGLLELSNKF